jgi:hypothetical protein
MNGRSKAFVAIGLIAALFVLGGPIYGQEQGSTTPEKGGVGYFIGGVGWMLESGNSSRGDFILVYPLIGLGGGAMTSAISSDVSKCALLNPAVGLDFLVPLRNRNGILLGLRGGYTFTVYSNTFNWSMPHIRVVIGGYGFGE